MTVADICSFIGYTRLRGIEINQIPDDEVVAVAVCLEGTRLNWFQYREARI